MLNSPAALLMSSFNRLLMLTILTSLVDTGKPENTKDQIASERTIFKSEVNTYDIIIQKGSKRLLFGGWPFCVGFNHPILVDETILKLLGPLNFGMEIQPAESQVLMEYTRIGLSKAPVRRDQNRKHKEYTKHAEPKIGNTTNLLKTAEPNVIV